MYQYVIDDIQLSKFAELFDRLEIEFKNKWGGIPFSEQSKIDQVKSLFFACAICHNVNWDFLCNNVIPKIRNSTDNFSLDKLTEIKNENIKSYFDGYNKPHKIDANRRTNMLIDLGKEISELYSNDFFYDLIDSPILLGNYGFLTKINSLSVFGDDPLHKKSNLLAQLLIRANLLNVDDEEKIEPAIDYHVIRVYLRTGRIKILSEELVNKFINRSNLTQEEITNLRKQIRDAMVVFCKQYNKSMAKLCFVDWIIGREYCHYDNPFCSNNTKKCPVCNMCTSCGLSVESMMVEPKNNNGHY